MDGKVYLRPLIRPNIAGRCQQTFEKKKFVDIIQQYFALLAQVNFPANGEGIKSRLSSYIFSTLKQVKKLEPFVYLNLEMVVMLELHLQWHEVMVIISF